MTSESRSDSDTRAESEASREQSESSGEERSDDPRDSEDAEDEIPLNIAGHEDRQRPSESDENPFGGDDESDGNGDEAATDTLVTGDPSVDGQPDPTIDAEADAAASTAGDGEDEEDEEPVEVLVNLAEDGEIDPWDIDIVAVTDKFLDRLDEGDLRTSGRALFYASVLLRMKSDAMLDDGSEEEDEPWEEPWEQGGEMADDGFEGPDPFAALESEMDRRLERRRARGMPQTLDELVRDLREAERDNWWKESREYDTSGSPAGFDRGTQELDYRSGDDFRMDEEPSAADVTDTAHEEHVDEIIDDVHDALREQYDKGREEVLYREISDTGGSRVLTFLGLLFLAHRGHVRLTQDEMFGDLWVQDPNAATGSEEAVAD
ncbi:chromosome segregation and condensation protein ScpA [Halosimplex carlsbadense 2-9-1]|uniref:Chromosome segregation and condensation protein ScpA n=1 Tax=Halosimplex carlsbadense 2-9-1 TaxID=797114 RepID=M0CC85_9EURY|nr:ScpA family protein [Halosimplex carlsbadense]ELZ20253.1 chromosome segregation and condensation protein ScpA [Halosimplex carlsbadense 2-9-1]